MKLFTFFFLLVISHLGFSQQTVFTDFGKHCASYDTLNLNDFVNIKHGKWSIVSRTPGFVGSKSYDSVQ